MQKLKRRQERRAAYDVFANPIFDHALVNECMSSEESCDEGLSVRGFPWRSSRLYYFYSTLDAEGAADEFVQLPDKVILKPRRAVPRKDRLPGDFKKGSEMPPKGIASWMVSRRWLNEQRRMQSDVDEKLKDIVVEHPDFNWNVFPYLGEESEDEAEPVPLPPQSMQQQHQQPPATYFSMQHTPGISYSLAHALTPQV